MDRSNLVKNLVGTLALANLAAFGIVVVGGNACQGGDGCLFYSALFFLAMGFAAMVLVASVAIWIWIRSKKRASIGSFFATSTLSLLAAALVMLGSLARDLLM